MLTRFLNAYFPHSELAVSFFPPPTKFDPQGDVPDLTGKVIIVTGANTGIGKETVKQLLLKNAKVYLAARSEQRAQDAIEWLRKETAEKGEVIFLKLDLGDLDGVRKSAEEFLSKESKLDVLINNAGVMMCPPEMLTKDGYDLQFGTNVLGHYFFTKLLVPALLAASDASGVPSRIVNLASSGHMYAPAGTGFVESTLVGGPERDQVLKSWGARCKQAMYGQSKLGNVFVTKLFENAHPGKLVAVSVHPGAILTELHQHLVKEGKLRTALEKIAAATLIFPARMGAYNSLYAGAVAPAEEVNGKYIVPWTRIGRMNPQAENADTLEQVRAWLEKQLLDH